MIRYFAAYLVLINLLTYGVYWWDKYRATEGKRRISERELLAWALAGGTLGAVFAMRRHRHKTQKGSFKAALAAVIAVQIGLFYWLTR